MRKKYGEETENDVESKQSDNEGYPSDMKRNEFKWNKTYGKMFHVPPTHKTPKHMTPQKER